MAKSYTTTSSNGTTYKVGSQKALDFIDSANIGATMVGGDGSKWVKNADGSTTVTDKNGVTSTFNAGRYDYSNDAGLESSDAVSGITRNVTGTPYAQTGRSISGQPTINFGTDTTDYATRAKNAQSRAELESWLSKLELQGAAQGRDTMAQVDQILTDWYARNGNRLDAFRNVTDHETGSGLTYTPGTYARVKQESAAARPATGIDDPLTAYMGLFSGENSAYSQALAQQQSAQRAATQQAVNALENQRYTTSDSYSDLFRQLYINKMKNQKNLAQQLAAQGITGGAAESTLLGMNTQYEDALRQGELERLSALRELDLAISDARLTGEMESANAAAKAAREQLSAYADALKYLINRQDTINARQEAYAREDAQRLAAYNQQLAKERREAEEAAGRAEKPTLTVAQVNAAIKAGVLTDAVLAAYEYYYGEAYRQ